MKFPRETLVRVQILSLKKCTLSEIEDSLNKTIAYFKDQFHGDNWTDELVWKYMCDNPDMLVRSLNLRNGDRNVVV